MIDFDKGSQPSGPSLPGQTPPPFIEQRPPGQRGARVTLWVVGVACLLVVLAGVLRVAVGGDDDETTVEPPAASASNESSGEGSAAAPPRTDGKFVTISGKGPAGNEISVTYLSEVDRYEPVSMLAVGRIKSVDQYSDGGIVSVERLPGGTCPKKAPETMVDGTDLLLSTNAFGDGPFRVGGRGSATPQVAGTYPVCAYLRIGQDAKVLVASGKIKVSGEIAPRSAGDADFVEPGVYAASGDDVQGGIDGARVELEVRDNPGEAGRKLVYVALSGAKDPGCEGVRFPVDHYTEKDLGKDTVYDTVAMVGVYTNISMTGGSWKPGEFDGQIYVSEGTCRTAVTFTAKRVGSGARKLQKELKP